MEIILQIYKYFFIFALKLIIVMRKFMLLFVFCLLTTGIQSQDVRDEIGKNIRCSAGLYMTYPGPNQQHLTPPPEGMKPFCISHYGRHGSRYQTRQKIYDTPYYIMEAADKVGLLTPLGRDVMARLDKIRRDADGRWGELTTLGAVQQREIIARMVSRFPEVFQEGCIVDARSTTMNRSLLSMENALIQLAALRPDLETHYEASVRDMHYLNQQDEELFVMQADSTARAAYEKFLKKTIHPRRLMHALFKDYNYVRRNLNARELSMALFRIASGLQDTEIGQQITLYDLFTDDELYDNWLVGNARWYVTHGPCTLNGGRQVYSQRNLLRKIIEQGDSCIQQATPNVQLRYGHATIIMPLVCLLEINEYGLATDRLEQLANKGWADYRIFPMSANIQFIFYRRNPQDQDVMFKVLLNENEVTLPLKSTKAPYYYWKDFREYYLAKLDKYEKR